MFAKTVRELEVYKLAYAIQQEIFEITKAFLRRSCILY